MHRLKYDTELIVASFIILEEPKTKYTRRSKGMREENIIISIYFYLICISFNIIFYYHSVTHIEFQAGNQKYIEGA